MRTRLTTATLLLLLALRAGPAAARTMYPPNPYPNETAAGRDWLMDRQPILVAGDLYYPAGPQVHFDAGAMVPSGRYEGVPLFVNTTIEPYSQVLVPIGRGLLQPYERRLSGELTATTGRAPSFPADTTPEPSYSASQGPWPGPPGAQRRSGEWNAGDRQDANRLLDPPGHIATARPPNGNRGIWITYEGQRWESAGEAVELDPKTLDRVGTYFGFPVFARTASKEATSEIFIPMRNERLAPYKKAAADPPKK